MVFIHVLNPEEALKWLREAYLVMDGLWFTLIERRLGLDTALALDFEVWKAFGKIVSRRVKRSLNVERGDLETIVSSLGFLFSMEGWDVKEASLQQGEACLNVLYCPWWSYLKKVGRESLVEKVCPTVCNLLFNSWASEFNSEVEVSVVGSPPSCVLLFKLKPRST